MSTEGGTAKAAATGQSASSWEAAMAKLREWDPSWAEHCEDMLANPWKKGVLSTKFIELVCVGLNAVHSNPSPDGARRHIRAAIAAGASRQEILFTLKCASMMSVHSYTFGAAILLKEASAGNLQDFRTGRKQSLQKIGNASPAVQKMKALGQWSEEWDSIIFLAPIWTEQYMAMCTELYENNVFSPKEIELLCIALEASLTQMYGVGAHRHIKNALKAGATVDEIVEVFKLCVVQGVQGCNQAVSILAEELQRNAASQS